MKHAKRIGALICVFAICFTLMAAPSAHAVGALGGQAAGAWIAAGLVGLNIVADIAIGSIGNYFGWQAHPTSTTLLEQDIKYTFPVASEYISNYMNASTIVVRQGVTTIDGVEYDEVFVDPGEFTTGLKTNLFDFKTKWNIISGQSALTLAEGVGSVAGCDLYRVGNTTKSQTFVVPGQQGSYSIGNQTLTLGFNQYTLKPISGAWTSYVRGKQSYNANWKLRNSTTATFSLNSGAVYDYIDVPWTSNPFHYKYTSGVVPAQAADIPSDYGLSLQIPHDKLQTFYNTYPQYNVDNSVVNIQEEQIDIDQLTQAIFDQITSMDDIRVEWKGEEEPEPPGPVPPEPAEDVLEGVNTIIGQQYTQIQQNQAFMQSEQQQIQNQQQQIQNQQQQIQQQQQINQNTSDIKDALENVTETPTSEDLPDFKFDLRDFFPFCIPFDIYRLLTAFDAEPLAPHVQIPFVIESLNFSYNIDLDFSVFDPVAQVLRTVEFIVYALGLAWATGKVIKW